MSDPLLARVWKEPLHNPLAQQGLLAGAACVLGHIHESHPGVLSQLVQCHAVLQRPKVAGQKRFTLCLLCST